MMNCRRFVAMPGHSQCGEWSEGMKVIVSGYDVDPIGTRMTSWDEGTRVPKKHTGGLALERPNPLGVAER